MLFLAVHADLLGPPACPRVRNVANAAVHYACRIRCYTQPASRPAPV